MMNALGRPPSTASRAGPLPNGRRGLVGLTEPFVGQKQVPGILTTGLVP
jgi:hypothetical protein